MSLCRLLCETPVPDEEKFWHDFRSRIKPESFLIDMLFKWDAQSDLDVSSASFIAQFRLCAIRAIVETERGLLESLDRMINCRRRDAKTRCEQLLAGFFLRRLSILWEEIFFKNRCRNRKPWSASQTRTC